MRSNRGSAKKTIVVGLLILIPGFGVGFAYYLWSLYSQLTTAFDLKKQSVPTRIYSDVTRVFLKERKSSIEDRLSALHYQYSVQDDEITFSLHEREYPAHLLPEARTKNFSQTPEIKLHFSSDHPPLLTEILIEDVPVEDLYLEPELVATLAQNTESQTEIRTYLKFEEIPSLMWKAIIAIEDQHFLEHKGLDIRGIMRAIWVNVRTLSLSQGGSTITQQLVKNLMARRTKNIFKKINELFLSILLESKFDKEQILERYLNEVYLGQVGPLEIHGVAEGGQYFFGKKLDELNLAEISLMAGLVRGPNFYSPYRYPKRAQERQNWVLKKMREHGLLAEAEIEAALKEPVRLVPPQSTSKKAPYFADYVKAEMVRKLKDRMNEEEIIQTGFKVYTTLDPLMNQAGQDAVRLGISKLEKKDEKFEGALAAVDHKTGFIRALIGGKNYSDSNFNRILNMTRQVGSAFKPLVYLTAFEKRWDENHIPYSPAHPIFDGPWTLIYGGKKQTWSPRNYERSHAGWVSYRQALSKSINVAAAKLAAEVGIASVKKVAQNLGIQSALPLVPSLSLGVSELSPIELLRVYATLANGGTQVDFSVIRAITTSDGPSFLKLSPQVKQVTDEGSVGMLQSILQDVMTTGTARSSAKLGWTRPAAGKTGTTNHHRDAWFAGYTPDLTSVVWVGNDRDTKAEGRLTGANSALPIWVSFMNQALQNEAPTPFSPTPSLKEMAFDLHSGKRARANCQGSQTIQDLLPLELIQDTDSSFESCEETYPLGKQPTETAL